MSDSVPMLPAEWSRQSAVMLTWPHAETDWAPILEQVEGVYLAIADAVTRHERLIVACHDEALKAHVESRLRDHGIPLERVGLGVAPSDDVWARDHGPLTVTENGQPRLLDFQFNGWGRKYPFKNDNRITAQLHQQGLFGDTQLEAVKLILEGGSIESDGAGTILTTTHCLLSPERNPEYDCVGLEGIFGQCFGTQRTHWLEHGELEGDDTDGHIDTLARFCDPHTIAYMSCDDPEDSHYDSLQLMEGQLREFTDNEGSPYKLVPLPLPQAIYDESGQRLPATYANFLIINDAVLVPTYDDPADEVALARLAECFPDRTLIPIDARPLIHQYGSIHCVTMQIPEGVV